jgi:uncharacterized protein (DUF488 family)
MTLYTLGSGRWPPHLRLPCMVQTLSEAGVRLLVDVRHSPCASSLDPASSYGPRDWNLQAGGRGIAHHLEGRGIGYLWLVELGNPQKNDPHMTVLRAHLAAGDVNPADEAWPVNRGLRRLRDLVRDVGNRCCLLCACRDYETCHRRLIAEALNRRYFGDLLTIRDLAARRSGGRPTERRDPGTAP